MGTGTAHTSQNHTFTPSQYPDTPLPPLHFDPQPGNWQTTRLGQNLGLSGILRLGAEEFFFLN